MSRDDYKLAPITSFRQIVEEVKYIAEIKSTLNIFGSSGYGKTVGLNYTTQHIDNSFLIDVRPAETSRVFLSRFLDALDGIIWGPHSLPKSGPISWLIERTCHDIRVNNKLNLIIIDEAGNLKKSSQSHLRQMIDNLKGYCGIVLAGPTRYRINLEKWSKDHSTGIPELMTRMHKRYTLDPPSFEDIELICRYNDISDMKVVKYIYDNCPQLRAVRDHIIDYKRGLLDI